MNGEDFVFMWRDNESGAELFMGDWIPTGPKWWELKEHLAALKLEPYEFIHITPGVYPEELS